MREISWTKNLIIMERCKDDFEGEFYIKWPKNAVERKKISFIKLRTYRMKNFAHARRNC